MGNSGVNTAVGAENALRKIVKKTASIQSQTRVSNAKETRPMTMLHSKENRI